MTIFLLFVRLYSGMVPLQYNINSLDLQSLALVTGTLSLNGLYLTAFTLPNLVSVGALTVDYNTAVTVSVPKLATAGLLKFRFCSQVSFTIPELITVDELHLEVIKYWQISRYFMSHSCF